MSRLGTLRSRLAALQAGRSSVRWGAALAAAVVAIVVALLVVFALDVAFALEIVQRVVVIALAACGVIWAIRKYSLPYLDVKEDLTELALMVERQHDIDSDLVAALQFEGSGTPSGFGSLQLQTAVIDYVAAALPRIDIFRGFDRSELWRRGFLAVAAIGIVALIAVIFPQHLQVFLNRLLLGHQHYPTQTQIEAIEINGKMVLVRTKWDDPLKPKEIACAQGETVTFRVLCYGRVPSSGTVKLVSQGTAAARTTLDLLPQATEVPAAEQTVGSPDVQITYVKFQAEEPAPAEPVADHKADEQGHDHDAQPQRESVLSHGPAGTWFTAELGRLVDGVTYTLHIGDAWTDTGVILLKPLPVIEPQLTTTPPTYAAGTQPAETTTARQIAVLEGTQIGLNVVCTNKRLQDCSLKIKTKDGWEPVPMKAVDKSSTKWVFADEANNPFSPIREEVHYELQVTDSDGLSLETPLRGQIRLRPDRPPVVSAGIVHKVVLPTASPVIDYRATDDFGLSQLKVVVEIERAVSDRESSAPVEDPSTSLAPGERKFTAETAEVPLPKGTSLPVSDKFSLDLSKLKLDKPLEKGDRARLVIVAIDDRGTSPGREAFSEPLLLEISDESGVLSAISEADQQSEEQLNEIIRRQLGIGETR